MLKCCSKMFHLIRSVVACPLITMKHTRHVFQFPSHYSNVRWRTHDCLFTRLRIQSIHCQFVTQSQLRHTCNVCTMYCIWYTYVLVLVVFKVRIRLVCTWFFNQSNGICILSLSVPPYANIENRRVSNMASWSLQQFCSTVIQARYAYVIV